MEILFIDESEVNRKENKKYFILVGLSIKSDDLIELENIIEEIKREHKITNLKELRTTKKIETNRKIELTKKIVKRLENFNASLRAIILGSLEDKYEKNYFGAITFIIERFYLKIKRDNNLGLIICDSLPPNKINKAVLKETSDYLKECSIILRGKSKGKISERIYPTLFFQNDEYSNVLQIVDLICASLQCAVREFDKSNPEFSIKDNEDLLKDFSPYMECYWNLFEKNPRNNSISGWGIKTWD